MLFDILPKKNDEINLLTFYKRREMILIGFGALWRQKCNQKDIDIRSTMESCKHLYYEINNTLIQNCIDRFSDIKYF